MHEEEKCAHCGLPIYRVVTDEGFKGRWQHKGSRRNPCDDVFAGLRISGERIQRALPRGATSEGRDDAEIPEARS